MQAGTDRHLNVDDVQDAYIDQKDRCVSASALALHCGSFLIWNSLVRAIDSTKAILADLHEFSKNEWVIRYPQLRQPSQDTPTTESPPRRHALRRSLSFADDPTSEREVVLTAAKRGLTRSITLASIADVQNEPASEAEEPESIETLIDSDPSAPGFHILRLDLKLGAHGSSQSSTSLVSQLEKSSIAKLLGERITTCVNHIEKLRLRVEDTSSKVLVTGDLNAGKSTFVNALLRREIMPVDQQPCTTVFCEVHDATENGGIEEVHVLKDAVPYDIKNESTYVKTSIADLEHFVSENESIQQKLRLYLADTRAPSESLLNNGVVDISLIDAPGLNRDSLKTTAVFTRQEEIDVVVFVVSAENHFTLSAKEFLATASKEKAYLFIVVNKFDQIKNKDKCRRLVLEQIRQLSPATHQDAADLVHFVDSAAALQPFTANPAFDDLESSLRSFVLVKRSKSKLHPAATYLSNMLSDVDLLAGANLLVARSELETAVDDLRRTRPVLEKMKGERQALDESLEAVEEMGCTAASDNAKNVLEHALDLVGQGKPGVESPTGGVSLPPYPGLLHVWDYAREVRRALLQSLDHAVRLAEDDARVITSDGVKKVAQLGEAYLPLGVERNRRVFMPEAMFSTMRRKRAGGKVHGRKMSSGGSAVVAGGVYGLGIGLAQRPDLLETTFFDLFDVHHQFWVHFGSGKDEEGGTVEDEETMPSALSLISVGVGALSMIGGQAVGARAVVEGIVRVTDLFGREGVRRWAAPVVGAATLGLTLYLVTELPSSIPRTVGRRIQGSLVKRLEGGRYVDVHAARVGRETRKVLRLASWDLKERFRGAMDERVREVNGAEEMERKARRASEWFEEIGKRSEGVRVDAQLDREL